MIPPRASAQFYGFYTLFSKFSSIWGPWVFAAVTLMAGSARTAILSLVAFFLVGLVLLVLVDEEEGPPGREGGGGDKTRMKKGLGVVEIFPAAPPANKVGAAVEPETSRVRITPT